MVCWGHKIFGCSFTVAWTTCATFSPNTNFLRTKQMSRDFKAPGLFLGSKGPDISMPGSSVCSPTESSLSHRHGTTLEMCPEEDIENDENVSKSPLHSRSAQNGGQKSMLVSHSFPRVSEKKLSLQSRRHSDNAMVPEANFCFGEPTYLCCSFENTSSSTISVGSAPPSINLNTLGKNTISNAAGSKSATNDHSRERERANSFSSTSTITSVDYGMSFRYWPAAIINNEMRVSASTTWTNPPLRTIEQLSSTDEISNLVTSLNGSCDSMLQMSTNHWSAATCFDADVRDGLINSAFINNNHNHNSSAANSANFTSSPISHSPKLSHNQEETYEILLASFGSTSGERPTQSLGSTELVLPEAESPPDDQLDDSGLQMKDAQTLSQFPENLSLSNETDDSEQGKKSQVNGKSQETGHVAKRSGCGILKHPTTFKISTKQVAKVNKHVRFLDSAGLPLTEVKEFNESEELMEKIQQFEKSERSLSKNEDEDSKPFFRCAFNQPAANYLEFRHKLEQNFVSLENLHFQGPRQFCGTVKVKNCAFEKKVFLRITFNSWESSSDIQCLYVDNGLAVTTIYDTFRFETVIPSSWHTYHKIQFSVCFVENGREHWDNNNGVNYSIVSNLDEVSYVQVPGGPYSPLFSFWRAHTSVDAVHPYW